MSHAPWRYRLGNEEPKAARHARGRGEGSADRRPFAVRLFAGVTALVVVSALSGLLATSGASFTHTSNNKGNVFTAGTLRLINSAGDTYVIDAVGLRPGQSVSGEVSLTNDGDFSAGCTVVPGDITDSSTAGQLSKALTLTFEDVTGTVQSLWSGTIDGFTSVSLGSFAVGQTRTYRITLTFTQANASPSLQGASAALEVVFWGVTR